ncbi:MAG: polysaccharide biosynthesis/export family protein [Polyangia bacterium]
MWPRTLTICAWMIAAAGCATQVTYDYSIEPDPRRAEYMVGPADVLKINVWREPELSVEARVRPDGTITMPLIGDIQAAGLPLSKIRAKIAAGLAAFVKAENLQVTIALVSATSYQFTITGNVEKNGSFTPANYITVLEAVTMAGGPNRFASSEKTFIIRGSASGTPRRIPVNIDQLRSGKQLEQNIVVLPGDIIVVP